METTHFGDPCPRCLKRRREPALVNAPPPQIGTIGGRKRGTPAAPWAVVVGQAMGCRHQRDTGMPRRTRMLTCASVPVFRTGLLYTSIVRMHCWAFGGSAFIILYSTVGTWVPMLCSLKIDQAIHQRALAQHQHQHHAGLWLFCAKHYTVLLSTIASPAGRPATNPPFSPPSSNTF